VTTAQDMLPCKDFVELTTSYVERDVPASSREAFEQHVLVCPQCRLYLEQIVQTTSLLSRLRSEGASAPEESAPAAGPGAVEAQPPGTQRALKFLAADRVAPFSGVQWPAPEDGDPWVEADDGVALCISGVHACRPGDLPFWLNEELWVVELEGMVDDPGGKLVARRGRLLQPVAGWDEAAKQAFGDTCVTTAREATVKVLGGGKEGAAKGIADMPFNELVKAAETLEKRGRDRRTTAAYSYLGYAALFRGDPAPVAFVAASAADHAYGDGAAAAERHRQVHWLEEELGLSSLLAAA